MKRKTRRNLLFWSIILLIILGMGTYFKYISPTKVGLINYPEFLHAKIAKSNENGFIQIDQMKPDSLKNLDSYDMLFVFGMGIKLPVSEEEKLIAAGKEGTKIYLQASTNPRLQLTNLKGKQLDLISTYMDNAGRENYRNMLNYVRKEIDEKKFFIDSIKEPVEIAMDVLFYKEGTPNFEKVEDFEDYCLKQNIHKKGQDKVVLFTSIPGPFNTNREHLDSMIEELESRNLNVYPVSSFRGRLSYLQKINPSLVIYLPHGRFSKKSVAALEKLNVPILCPISVFQEHDKWLKDKMGMFGGLLSQSVTMPEFDGGIVPYAVFAQFRDKNGLLLFRAIPDRLKKFGQICDKYIHLQKEKNKEKKIAIVYFKGPGKNSLNAANMEVLPSLHNMLLRLKKEGYNLGDLPNRYENFQKEVMKRGLVLGPYAQGAFDKYLKNGNPELIPAYEYEKWCKQTLPQELYTEVEKRYGKAPGSYMSVYKDTTDYVAVARVQFGNVVLLPQALPGLGDDEFALIHGAKVAPPHAYIAPYLWIQKGFKADAIFHFGTHGSLEFTPGKQIALSNYDWTDPLIGTTPHFYVYTISNVGEAMIAKRRSYAATQTYLTPPFIEAQALGSKNVIHQKVQKYEQAKGALKSQYALAVKKMVVEEGIHKDLELDSIVSKAYNADEMMRLANYLEEVEHEKVTGGLYTMGVPYESAKLKETIRLMMVDALAYNLAEIDVLKGKLSREKMENKMLFNKVYGQPCEKHIQEVLQTKNSDRLFQKLVSKIDQERAEKWNKKKNARPKRRHPHAMMMQANKVDTVASEVEKKNLRKLIIQILPIAEKKEYIAQLESDKKYEKSMSLLDEDTFASAQKMARFIPSMKKALEIASDSTVHEILLLMKKPELRDLALNCLQDPNLKKEVEAEEQRQNEALLKRALALLKRVNLTTEKIEKLNLEELQKLSQHQRFYQKTKANLVSLATKKDEQVKLIHFLQKDLTSQSVLVSRKIKYLTNVEDQFAMAVNTVRKTLQSILLKKESLYNSPKLEFDAIVNSLNGGYTSPSTGGDPISNPSTIPTGRNLVAVDAEKTPTKEAWKVGKKLGNALLENYTKKHEGAYPEKISFTLWAGSFIESEGTTVAQILYMLGVEPIWDPFGRVRDIRLIPTNKLKRPRIDVVVQTSGQLRDIGASRLFLINKAIRKVANEASVENNFVNKGVQDAEKRLIEKGFSPKDARKLSTRRVFGGVNGTYGTGIMGMVENSDRWDSTKVVAQTYINNMGAVYGDENDWGDFEAGVFEAALLNTSAVVQPRQSNTWGALSLDHVYEFMGGINLAVKEVTGNDPEAYFNDFRNSSNPHVQGLKEAIWVESRTTLLNPRYIKEYMKGGASSAETFAETFRNTFGWNVMKESVIEDRLWNKLYDTYVEDKQNLNIHEFFKRENPYALQEMTAVMLETVRKGMWKASKEQVAAMAKLHAQLVKEHEAGCSGFVCDNEKLKQFINKNIDSDLAQQYNQEISTVREASVDASKENVVLKKEEKIQAKSEQSPELTINKWLVFILLGGMLSLFGLFIVKRRRS